MTNQMIDLSGVDYDLICRACLTEGELNSIYSSVTDETGEVQIAEMLMACSSVTIVKGDGLPTKICSNCIFQAKQSYTFKLQCERASVSLHYYADNKQKVIEPNEVKNETTECSDVDNETFEDLTEETVDNGEVTTRSKSKKGILKRKSKRVATVVDPETKLTCFQCDIKFANRSELKQHRKKLSHPRERKHKCSICAKCFLTSSHRRSHMLVHTEERPFVCHYCERRFNSKPNLKRHVMIHTGERPHRCQVCNKGFIQSVTLADHMRVHTKETPYVCSTCGRGFKQAGELRRHMKKSHDPNSSNTSPKRRSANTKDANKVPGERRKRKQNLQKAFLCCNCGKSFASNTLLQIHNRIHTGEKPYSCTVCSKAFSQISTLNTHMLVHTGEKKYDCTLCNKSFRHRVALKQHILIHMGIRKYSCTFCPKTFTQSSQLNYHLRTHTGEKPYSCGVCGKSFALKGNLTVHIRTHTGETPYICPVCGKGFYDSSSMKKHHRGHDQNC